MEHPLYDDFDVVYRKGDKLEIRNEIITGISIGKVVLIQSVFRGYSSRLRLAMLHHFSNVIKAGYIRYTQRDHTQRNAARLIQKAFQNYRKRYLSPTREVPISSLIWCHIVKKKIDRKKYRKRGRRK